MHLIVGLGNPGSEYVQTRHNVGFLVADEIAASNGVCFRPGRGNYWTAECSLKGNHVVVMKPSTYMNNSGIALMEFMASNDAEREKLLIVCDDFNLPLGSLRLRRNGTDGGHNGLASVIYNLQTDRFARLRCGIGRPSGEPVKGMKDFVLEKFSSVEIGTVESMIKQACEACESYVTEGIERTMNRYNTILPENE